MAGFSKLYAIGGSGFDGINPISLQIWVGDADRQWLEAHYIDQTIKPLGSVRRVIPARPNAPEALLDACIAFFPTHFARCRSLPQVAAELDSVDALDFNNAAERVPKKWTELRDEAMPLFSKLNVFEAVLRRVGLH